VAVPTTTGTGAESTTICVLDVLAQKVKTGISHPGLRPTLAVVDPALTVTQPAAVTASSGMDILCHALEARGRMALAATMAGLGFGNAGVHIPHANAYPIAGRVKDFRPDAYPKDEPIVPHGMAVSLTAPEAFRFTFPASPERHLRAAELLAPGLDRPGDDAEQLPAALVSIMRDVGIPNGIDGVGYDEGDVGDLVEGTMKQQRLLDTAPRPVTPDDAAAILTRSLANW
jgi:hydroxyacid-oxoacid transhydrogenase